MQGHNPFAQFQTAGPKPGQFPNANPNFNMPPGGNPKLQGNPQQQGQFNPQQFPNQQMMQFQTMQPQMFPNMMANQMGANNPGMNPQNAQPQQNITPPQKPRLIVKLENNERGFYSTMLSQLDPTERGRVDGKEAAAFFRKSGLPSDVLKKIWLISTSDNKTLDKEEFYVYMRLVAYAQNNVEVAPQSILQNLKAPLPKFLANVPPPQKREEPTTPKDSGANLLDMGGPVMPNVQGNVQQNPQLVQPGFGNMNNPGMMPNLMGNTPVLPQANLMGNTQTLPQPNLMGNMGNMDLMGGMGGNMPIQNPIPTIPQQKIAQPDLMGGDLLGGDDLLGGEPVAVTPTKIESTPVNTGNAFPQAQTNPGSMMNLSNIQSSPMGGVKQEEPLSMGGSKPVSEGAIDDSQGFTDVLVDITPEYLTQYETIYNQYDSTKKGILTQQEIGDVFLRSGLGNDVLFQIWSFCDSGDRGCLDKPEFMLALHLMAMAKKKIRIPSTLPPQYQKFLKEMKKKLPGKDYLVEKARQALEESNPSANRQSHHGDEYDHQPSGGYGGEQEYNNYEASHQRNDYGGHQDGDYETRDDVPLTQGGGGNYGRSSMEGQGTGQLIGQLQAHQNELMATASHITDRNNRLISEKKEDIRQLDMILRSCQDILQKLVSENDYLQHEMVTLDNQKKNIQNSIESVQQRISQELARQQGLHRAIRNGETQSPQVRNRTSMVSPQKPQDEQFGVDFQKEFAGGWGDGFDNNDFGDQNKNPNTANNFGDFNDF